MQFSCMSIESAANIFRKTKEKPNDVIDISVSCCSEVRMIKKVFSTDYKNPALAENLEKQYRSYKEAEKQLRHG